MGDIEQKAEAPKKQRSLKELQQELTQASSDTLPQSEFLSTIKRADSARDDYLKKEQENPPHYFGSGNTLDDWGPALRKGMAIANEIIAKLPREQQDAAAALFRSELTKRVADLRNYADRAGRAGQGDTAYVRQFEMQLVFLGHNETFESFRQSEFLSMLDRLDFTRKDYKNKEGQVPPKYYHSGNTLDDWGPYLEKVMAVAHDAIAKLPPSEQEVAKRYAREKLATQVVEFHEYAERAKKAEGFDSDYVQKFVRRLEEFK